MKKFTSLLLALAMVFALAACGGNDNSAATNPPAENTPAPAEDTQGPADNAQPADSGAPEDGSTPAADGDLWTAQGLLKHFQDTGLFVEGNGFESWEQDHANYWPGTPVKACTGYWDDQGLVMVMILELSDGLDDCPEETYNAWMSSLTGDHALPDDYSTLLIDHMVGNIVISYSMSVDDDFYSQMDAAWNDLVSSSGLEQVF